MDSRTLTKQVYEITEITHDVQHYYTAAPSSESIRKQDCAINDLVGQLSEESIAKLPVVRKNILFSQAVKGLLSIAIGTGVGYVLGLVDSPEAAAYVSAFGGFAGMMTAVKTIPDSIDCLRTIDSMIQRYHNK